MQRGRLHARRHVEAAGAGRPGPRRTPDAAARPARRPRGLPGGRGRRTRRCGQSPPSPPTGSGTAPGRRRGLPRRRRPGPGPAGCLLVAAFDRLVPVCRDRHDARRGPRRTWRRSAPWQTISTRRAVRGRAGRRRLHHRRQSGGRRPAAFVEHRPAWLHLLLLGRRRPARRRPPARERALADLSFDAPAVLRRRGGRDAAGCARCRLTPSAIATWSGGWAAALQLAALSSVGPRHAARPGPARRQLCGGTRCCAPSGPSWSGYWCRPPSSTA